MDRDALKVMLRSATTLAERTEAVQVAVRLGMSLREIEEYLDWLDATRRPRSDGAYQKRCAARG
jgi:DNA-binding transcriptional MerR regulator